MRNHIDLVEQLNEAALEEGKIKNMMAAGALTAAALNSAFPDKSDAQADHSNIEMIDASTVDDMTSFDEVEPFEEPEVRWVDDAEAKKLGLTDLDQVEPFHKKEKSVTKSTVAKKAPAKVTQKGHAHTKDEVQLLALTMWGEARSGGADAMRAVGHVVMNRIASERKFGRSITQVVWKRKAFSCWNPSDPNREAMRDIAHLPEDDLDKKRYRMAVRIAKQIVDGQSKDPTGGALFYHTTNISPYWAKGVEPLKRLGSHLFYDKDRKI